LGKIRSTNQVQAHGLVYVIAPDLEALLSNWGRWAAVRVGRGRYVNAQFRNATRGGRWEPCAAVSVSRVDADSAWRVEQTICDPMFSPRFRTLLTEHYAHQRRLRDVCKLLFLPERAYEAELWKACAHFSERYARKFPGGIDTPGIARI
jgi:hypothetical protein